MTNLKNTIVDISFQSGYQLLKMLVDHVGIDEVKRSLEEIEKELDEENKNVTQDIDHLIKIISTPGTDIN